MISCRRCDGGSVLRGANICARIFLKSFRRNLAHFRLNVLRVCRPGEKAGYCEELRSHHCSLPANQAAPETRANWVSSTLWPSIVGDFASPRRARHRGALFVLQFTAFPKFQRAWRRAKLEELVCRGRPHLVRAPAHAKAPNDDRHFEYARLPFGEQPSIRRDASPIRLGITLLNRRAEGVRPQR